MSEREKISVDIYGQLYNLRVTPEEKERVLAIAHHVDNMMKKVADSQGRLDAPRAPLGAFKTKSSLIDDDSGTSSDIFSSVF